MKPEKKTDNFAFHLVNFAFFPHSFPHWNLKDHLANILHKVTMDFVNQSLAAEHTTRSKEAYCYTTTTMMTTTLTTTTTTINTTTITTIPTALNIHMTPVSYQPGDAVDYVS